ncbi:MAG: LVIVD repeat-containing protein [Ginsengibacter sp.]
MKKSTKIFKAVLVLFLFSFLNSCVKDTCRRIYTYSYYLPVYKTTAEVRANIKSSTPQEITNPGKIVLLGNYIFLNEVDKGIHIIDNHNPASPKNVAFINIPGNMDLALKVNILYADLYTDMVTLDISNPLNVLVKKYSEGVFPYRIYNSGFYGDSTKIITDWIKRDTTVIQSCGGNPVYYSPNAYVDFSSVQSSGSNKNSSSPIGKGGSMARFAIVNNRIYTVSNTDLNVFDITTTDNPVYKNKVNVGSWSVETIFPFKDKLFIGSQNGMFIYNINNPDNPVSIGQFSHVQSCDPVIADDNFAYVTLRSGSACQGFSNQLEILQLNNITDPKLIKVYPFTNPHGLCKDGNLLFICDGSDGLKIYNATDVNNLKPVKQVSGIETYDVIAYNNIALVVAKDGLYQYDYSDIINIHLISRTGISKT